MLPCTHILPYNPLARKAVAVSQINWADAQLLDQNEAEFAQIARTAKAALAAVSLNAEVPSTPGANEWIESHLLDKAPENYPAWLMLAELWDEIIALPCSALVMKHLLYSMEYFRLNYACIGRIDPGLDTLWVKIYAMIERIASESEAELEVYAALEAQREEARRKHKKFEGVMRGKRPADIYRRYGLALRYAVETLGSFRAKDALNALMLSVTIPVDELENPEWIDVYTGETDPDYEYLRMRNVEVDEVSSDGNLPVVVADLLDNMDADGQANFAEQLHSLGMDTGDYWRQFREAQRSGFTMVPEPEDQVEDDDTDSVEKDFEFKADLMIDPAMVYAIKGKVGAELYRIRELTNSTAREVASVREVENSYQRLWAMVWDGRPDLTKIASGEYAVLLNTCVIRTEFEIDFIRDRLESEFPDGHPYLEGKIKFLPFKYPVDIKKTSLGYLLNLLGSKIKALFAMTWDIARARFFADYAVKSLIRQFSDWALREDYEPKDLMAVLLPCQNAYGFREDDPADDDLIDPTYDLGLFRIPGAWGGTLHGFMVQCGEEYLEQFITGGGAGIVPSVDPESDALETWTDNLVADRKRTYLSKNGALIWRRVYAAHEPDPKSKVKPAEQKRLIADQWFDMIYTQERQAELEKISKIGMKPNQRNNREFIEAEVDAAFLGDGSPDGIKQAGWDAYRQNIDPQANMEFKRVLSELRRSGMPGSQINAEAMKSFWAVVERNKSKIAGVTPDGKGLVLVSGRKIDWGIAKLKIEKHEIPDDLGMFKRLLAYLVNNRFAPYLQPVLRKRIAEMEAADQ